MWFYFIILICYQACVSVVCEGYLEKMQVVILVFTTRWQHILMCKPLVSPLFPPLYNSC